MKQTFCPHDRLMTPFMQYCTTRLIKEEWDALGELHAVSLTGPTPVGLFLCCRLPLFTGGSVNVHALGSGQGLRLGFQAVGGRAGQRADALAALAAIRHPCNHKHQLGSHSHQLKCTHSHGIHDMSFKY